ncbi:prepilin-type N-terminal cleavage/methylation domain-containing protein [Nocardioides bizhenqiangii]|uniref:Prepilin-type N-terminal cleavage/methylation domain-containing protein n=1 Tax=Nocardioides bizhenqiangii TaxID=3095076 RepID=A0ABZ0ZRH9_9ACTN|nr:prepilin-type N-terminal cleavage/methylation domain-containing protein [Nocardioides sp. HM61]WQQ26237.1 prepilin-type N-terminal cleavage/methylation domain-containing protein [Nocardioides sp. HM61]
MRVIRRLRALGRRDDGFTLVEMIVNVAIIGVIASALAGVVISYLKTTAATESRLVESHDVQFAAAYWQRDVASIGVRTYDSGTKTFPLQQSVNVTPACSMPAGTTTVVTLAWSEYTDLDSTAAPTTITVSYVAEPDAGGYNLLRVRCTGSTKDSQFEVTHSLNALPTATCNVACTSAPDVPTVVELHLSVRDPDRNGGTALTATLAGERRQT